jgi:hypothetical protein
MILLLQCTHRDTNVRHQRLSSREQPVQALVGPRGRSSHRLLLPGLPLITSEFSPRFMGFEPRIPVLLWEP